MLKILFIDIDKVLAENKLYDKEGNVFKTFNDHDFTAIKMFKAKGVKVVALTADPWNEKILYDRKIPFHITLDKDSKINKEDFIREYVRTEHYEKENMAYVGDDIMDIGAMRMVGQAFYPKDASLFVRLYGYRLDAKSGEGVLEEIYKFYFDSIDKQEIEKVIEIDAKERRNEK